MNIMNFEYTGAVQEVTLNPGKYILECWGAEGGTSANAKTAGGKGGYSTSTLTLTSTQKIYVYVGGKGSSTTTSGTFTPGGFNGGGNAGYWYGGSGGGGSDIRIGQDSLYARVIVAGGGGGAFDYSGYIGGIGGGENGGAGTGYSSAYAGTGGTQTAGGAAGVYGSYTGSPGTFGVGGNASTTSTSYNRGAGGGGGWYGGGGTAYRGSSSYYYRGGGGAGGGSGFVWQGSNAPSGYLLGSQYYLTDAQTIAGSSSFNSPTGTSEIGHAGNGYVRITQLKPNPPTNLTETHDYFGASVSWTGVSGVSGYKVYLNGTLKTTTTATSCQLLGLNASTDYTVKVVAYDATGDSDPAEVTFTTPSANFRQTAREYQSISLAWNSSAKATGYKLYRNGTLIATLTGTNYTDNGLLPSNEYNYSLRAYSGSSEGVSGTLTGKTEEAGWEQKVVFKTIKITPNPTIINTKVTLTVTAEDELVIYEPEKFYSGEIYSGEL